MRNLFKKVLLGSAVALALQGCSLFGGDEDLTPMAPLPKVDSAFEGKSLWRSSVGDGIGDFYSQLRPVINGDRIYAASRDGDVTALERDDGKEVWSTDLADLDINADKRSPRLSGGLVQAYGKLFLGSENGVVYALSADDGKVLWHVNVPGEVVSSPAVEDGRVVVLTTSGRLMALDSEDGKLLWTLAEEQPPLTLRSVATPVITNGAVLYGRADGKVGIALLSNGQPVRQSKVADPRGATELDRMVDVDATPLVAGDELYAIAYNGQLMARKLLSGDEVWKRKYSAYRDMAVGSNEIFITDSRSHLFAVDRRNGLELWSNTQLENRSVTAPVVFGDYVVVGDVEGYLYWLDRFDGTIKAMQELDSSGLYAAPLVDGGTLYIQSRGGKLYALQRP
ncbi:outer membrane protein assembly factor BamB [Aeromonas simiae]|uniref:outer membrane protein assembly factor BamB n=1 Tax=Aeromonas simiae TaxID=218936 RepID=UPI0005A9F660|nr:outer membrane protein assembly factor BamB [Aeromonas simiae]MDO2947370.1 outer membrane protein assembly factor BamB [Aeromonas simiae]MDO2951086.1 outer membrane protein assembly factor BamB [Aeromonas simiae]MDO2954674.1 outer membrane protein assembly factor BamB [Aeromonas simiae]